MNNNDHGVAWLQANRIPAGSWPFLNTVRESLRILQLHVVRQNVDLTEGLEAITITGRLEAYRQVILRRALDLAQATVLTWNGHQAIGAVVCARGLLETLAAFHDLFEEAKAAAEIEDWEAISRLVDSYAFSTSRGPQRTTGKPGGPPSIGKQVVRFIAATQPGAESFWHEISDLSHPNGRPTLRHFASVTETRLVSKPATESEPLVFPAIYNCLYSICWLLVAMTEFDALLDRIRYVAGGRE